MQNINNPQGTNPEEKLWHEQTFAARMKNGLSFQL
jgi:hypothetical protein